MTIIEICPDTTALRRSANQRRDKGFAILPKTISCLPCPKFRCSVLHYGDFQGYRTGSERNILNPRSSACGWTCASPVQAWPECTSDEVMPRGLSCTPLSAAIFHPSSPDRNQNRQVDTVFCEAKVRWLRFSKCRVLPPCSPKPAVYAKKQPHSTRHLSRTLTTVCNTDVNNGPMLGCRSRAS